MRYIRCNEEEDDDLCVACRHPGTKEVRAARVQSIVESKMATAVAATLEAVRMAALGPLGERHCHRCNKEIANVTPNNSRSRYKRHDGLLALVCLACRGFIDRRSENDEVVVVEPLEGTTCTGCAGCAYEPRKPRKVVKQKKKRGRPRKKDE